MNNTILGNILNKGINSIYMKHFYSHKSSIIRTLHFRSFSEIVKHDNEGKNKFNIQITDNCVNVN
jgi:hypothetical protein